MRLSKLSCIVVCLCLARVAAAQSTRPHPDLTKPAISKTNPEKFLKLHNDFLARAKSGPVGLLFLGDSITANWAAKAPDLFEKEYGPYHPANFGIGGDHVNGVLWRVQNGELENVAPKVTVLLIGTNDSGTNTGHEIASGVENLVKEIHTRLPHTKVLLLAIFPRGPHKATNGTSDDGTAKMAVIRAANEQLAKLDDGGKTLRFLDIGPKFLDENGKIPDDVMADQLHPTHKGYQIWADAMRSTLDELMK